MIFKYSSNEFENFRDKIFEILREEVSKGHISENRKSFAGTIYTLCKDENLKKIDDLKLLNHNPSNLDASPLKNQTNILHRVYQLEKIGNYDADDVMDSLYLLFYADIYEASLISTEEKISSYLEDCINKLQDYSFFLSGYMLQTLHSLWFRIPKRVFDIHLEQNLSKRALENINKLQKNEDFIIENLATSERLLEQTREIKSDLEEQKSEYNFVSLSKGFSSLKDAKKKEMRDEKIVYRILMGCIILTIIIKFAWSIFYLNQENANNLIFITTTASTIFLLLIILYFFRISLSNIKSIRSQILQIDLRITLCQFIHNYNSDTEKLRAGMKESFDNFEKVIFAPIVASEDQMPNTFDGLDQITNLLSSIINKGK